MDSPIRRDKKSDVFSGAQVPKMEPSPEIQSELYLDEKNVCQENT